MELRLHSRHIPREHLDFSVPAARSCEENGLCDVLERLPGLVEKGIRVIETRLTWNELADESGWERFGRAVRQIEEGGALPGVFCWFQHPPVGDTTVARLRCLEHGEESTIASLWDPALLRQYDRLYGELHRRFGERIRFIYVGVYGDYGEVAFPGGVRHYRFSPPHGHDGFWCGDRYARESFRSYLREKYGTAEELAEHWGEAVPDWDADLMPRLPFPSNSRMHRVDFAEWYTRSLTEFTDRVCATVAKWFPDVPKGLPIGFVEESLPVGQIKSEAARIAARWGAVARWTGMGFLGDYALSDVLAKRISCAAGFYGAEFGTEAALKLDASNAGAALYECLSNASALIHNDPGNVDRAGRVWDETLPKLRVSRPVQELGVYYPVEGEMLCMLDAGTETRRLSYYTVLGQESERQEPIGALILRCGDLRSRTDYALFDSNMLRAGYLKRLRTAFFVIGGPVPEDVCRRIDAWAADGGAVFLLPDVRLTVLETGEAWEPRGAVRGEPPVPARTEALRRTLDPEKRLYMTEHERFISLFDARASAAGDAEHMLRFVEKSE